MAGIFSAVILALGVGLVSGVPGAKAGSVTPSFTSFCVGSPSVCGTITMSDGNTVTITVPFGTDVSNLRTDFTFNGLEVWSNGMQQYSGDSSMNFSSPVVYTVYTCSQQMALASGRTKMAMVDPGNFNFNMNIPMPPPPPACLSTAYTVTVNVAKPVQITAFGFTSPSATGSIDQDAKTISVTVPAGTDVTALAPTVVFDGDNVYPASGATQDFTNPVTYTVNSCRYTLAKKKLNIAVTERCGVPYVVTVTVAAPPAAGGGGSTGGSGWEDPHCRMPVTAPQGGFSLSGVGGNNVTSQNVTLALNGGNANFMEVSNNLDMSGATVEPYAPTKAWTLTDGYGSKLVYARFYNLCNVPTAIISTQFNYAAPGKVLGVVVFADGTLLRGPDHKIYVIKNGHKVHIHSLAELVKHYRGRPIIDVTEEVLEQY